MMVRNRMFRHINHHAKRAQSFYDGIGNTAVIYPVALLTSFALGLTNLGIVFFARDIFDATPVTIGWLAGTWAVAYAIGCILLRSVLGKFPARYLIITSSSLMFLCIFTIQFVSSLTFVFVLFAMYGLSMSLFWSPLMAWLSDGYEGASLGHRFSRYNIMWSFGSIASPYVCGWLTERSARYPLFLGSGIFLVGAIFVFGAAFILPSASSGRSLQDADDSIATEKTNESMLRFPAWVGLFATFFGFGVIFSIFPLTAQSELGLSESSVGLLLLVRALASAITFFIIGKVVFWHFKVAPIFIGQILATMCFISLCFFHTAVSTGLFFGLLGIFAAFSYSTSVFHGVTGSVHRVKRMSIHESTLAFGLISGSAVAGIVYNVSSMTHVYAMCAGVLLVGLVVQGVLYMLPPFVFSLRKTR